MVKYVTIQNSIKIYRHAFGITTKQNAKCKMQNAATKSLLLKSHLWLFVAIRGVSYHEAVVIPARSCVELLIPCHIFLVNNSSKT
jgi:hypothetical protein